MLGRAAICFAGLRIQRKLPWKMFRLTLGEQVAQKTIDEFLVDIRLFDEFVAKLGKIAEEKAMCVSHPLRKINNLQWRLGCVEFGDMVAPDLNKLAESKMTGCEGTVIMEELIGLAKIKRGPCQPTHIWGPRPTQSHCH